MKRSLSGGVAKLTELPVIPVKSKAFTKGLEASGRPPAAPDGENTDRRSD
jgi:hypothetical protein